MDAFEILGVGLLFVLLVLLWAVPIVAAWNHRHPHRGTILVLDLLLGWTVIGWAVLVAWAFAGVPRRLVVSCPVCRLPMQLERGAAAGRCRTCGTLVRGPISPSPGGPG